MRISRTAHDADGVPHVIENDLAASWSPLAAGIAAALRELDAAALIVRRLCPGCRVDLGDAHEPGCPLAPSNGAFAPKERTG